MENHLERIIYKSVDKPIILKPINEQIGHHIKVLYEVPPPPTQKILSSPKIIKKIDVNNPKIILEAHKPQILTPSNRVELIKTQDFVQNHYLKLPQQEQIVHVIHEIPKKQVVIHEKPKHKKIIKILSPTPEKTFVEEPKHNYVNEKQEKVKPEDTNNTYVLEECQLFNCTNGNKCGICTCLNDMLGCPVILWIIFLLPFIFGILSTLAYFMYSSPIINQTKAINRQINKTNYFINDLNFNEYNYVNVDPCVTAVPTIRTVPGNGFGLVTTTPYYILCNTTTTIYITDNSKNTTEYTIIVSNANTNKKSLIINYIFIFIIITIHLLFLQNF